MQYYGHVKAQDPEVYSAMMRELERRAALVRGYEPKSFYLLSKHALPKGAIEKAAQMINDSVKPFMLNSTAPRMLSVVSPQLAAPGVGVT